ncbi:hypothetical protein ACEWY4_024079 [Coilia grayii]|uniref:Ion transport domain-containing protein n=1 Tax=Coilia grayii TaxID=363190 RepID=A0ABD1J2E8_9TELE
MRPQWPGRVSDSELKWPGEGESVKQGSCEEEEVPSPPSLPMLEDRAPREEETWRDYGPAWGPLAEGELEQKAVDEASQTTQETMPGSKKMPEGVSPWVVACPGPPAQPGECSQRCFNIFVLETVCVGWFSLEFLLRFIQTQSKCTFLRTPLNIIDVVAILPYYITLIVDALSAGEKPAGSGNNYLEKVGLVLRVLRALRIFYVMRLARHSLGLQTLGLTVRRCTREFGLLLLFLCVAMALFSPLVFLAESELGAKQEFTSIPGSYWWAVISMTTVGYGDMVPRSIPGQVVALSSILSGILLMAFPVTSIFHTFSRSYLELKEEQSRALRQRPDSQDSTKSQNSEDSQDTDNSYPMTTAAAAQASVAALHRRSIAVMALQKGEEAAKNRGDKT